MDHDHSSPGDRKGGIHQEMLSRSISSSELLQGRRELHIEHSGEIYRLRLTKAGKLILTK